MGAGVDLPQKSYAQIGKGSANHRPRRPEGFNFLTILWVVSTAAFSTDLGPDSDPLGIIVQPFSRFVYGPEFGHESPIIVLFFDQLPLFLQKYVKTLQKQRVGRILK